METNFSPFLSCGLVLCKKNRRKKRGKKGSGISRFPSHATFCNKVVYKLSALARGRNYPTIPTTDLIPKLGCSGPYAGFIVRIQECCQGLRQPTQKRACQTNRERQSRPSNVSQIYRRVTDPSMEVETITKPFGKYPNCVQGHVKGQRKWYCLGNYHVALLFAI